MKLRLFSLVVLIFSHESLLAEPANAKKQALLKEESRLQSQRASTTRASNTEPIRLTSELGAFTVMSRDSLRAGAVASRADDIYRHLEQLIGLPSKPRHMVLIELVGEPQDAPELHSHQLSIDLLGEHPVVRLSVHVGGGIQVAELHRSIVRACLYEYALREMRMDAYADEDDMALSLPLWLTTGIEQAVLWRGGRLDRDLFSELFTQSEMLSIRAMLSMTQGRALDGTTQQLFDASCTALMLALLNQEGGKQAVLSMLDSGFNADRTAQQILMSHFHTMGIEDNALQKWWALELANMASPSMRESMTPLQTEEQLVGIMEQHYVDRATGQMTNFPVDDFDRFTQHPEWRALIPAIQRKLQTLYLRSFPGYRPIIAEYQELLNELLLDDDLDEYRETLSMLRSLRENYRKVSTRTRDYLDWYEMTHLGGEMSADFQQYLRMREQLRRQPDTVETHMSRYLRDIEMLMELSEGEALPSVIQKEAIPSLSSSNTTPSSQ